MELAVSIVLLAILIILANVAQYSYKLQYNTIYDYRCKLVDLEFYKLKKEELRCIKEASQIRSNDKLMEWYKNHPEYKDISGKPRILDTYFTKLDITIPDDGPFTQDDADAILANHFSDKRALVNRVLVDYYNNALTEDIVELNKELSF